MAHDPDGRVLKMYQTERQRDIRAAVDEYLSEVPVKMIIDGVEIEPEECTEEIDRTGGEIQIKMILGLKRMIQRHPEEFVDELHYPFFTDEERATLLMRKTA